MRSDDREAALGEVEPLAARLRQLETADPERLTLALVRHAGWRLIRLRLSGRGLAGGLSAQDLAHEAIKKFLGGERKWNHAVYPTLLDCLKSVVDSLTWNCLTSDEHRKVRRGEDGFHPEPRAAEPLPDAVLLDRLDEALAERFWLELELEIQAELGGQIREELQRVCRTIRTANAVDYAGIAASTGLDQGLVYRRFYRLEALALRAARRVVAPATVTESERCHAG